MGVATRKRARKAFKYNINRKRLRNRVEQKYQIPNNVMTDVFEKSKSVSRNMNEAGFVFKLNKIFDEDIKKTGREKTERLVPEKHENVVQTMETAVDKARAMKVTPLRMPKSEIDFLEKMMKKYGDDYKEMAKDPMNYYQDTPTQIKNKIRKYLDNPEFLIPMMKRQGYLQEKKKKRNRRRKTKKQTKNDEVEKKKRKKVKTKTTNLIGVPEIDA